MYKKLLIGSAVLATTLSLQASSVEDLDAKVSALTKEIAKIKDSSSSLETDNKLTFGGYGKMDYINYLDNDDKQAKLDMYRFILYAAYEFSDRVKLVSELEWEHGGREKTGGYGIIEQAYLDIKATDNMSVKVGHVIVPMGYVNLYHEPTSFNAVNRPEVEKYIIPSTWHENGILVHGNLGSGISYQAGMVAGLNASNGKDIRHMRQNGQKSKADDFGFVGRLDYKGGAGISVGGSIYNGKAEQGEDAFSGVETTLTEIHARYNLNGFDIRALYAMNEVTNANKVAIKHEGTALAEGSGFYVNVAYSVNSEWTPFVRYENYNKAYKSFDKTGTKLASADDITNATIGINYNLATNVVLKADYVIRDNKGTDDNMLELGMGYSF